MSTYPPIYDQTLRMRHYTRQVSVFSAVSDRDRATILLKLLPAATVKEHADLARHFAAKADEFDKAYSEALKEAFLKAYGREPQIYDYRIACIWDDQLPESDKQLLRQYGYGATSLRKLAAGHAAASARRSRAPKYS